jgi:hypothetical protein
MLQIGRRIQWLERAQNAADRDRMKRRSGINVDSDEGGVAINLDACYEVPINRKDPISIFKFVHEHREDPAIAVCILFKL